MESDHSLRRRGRRARTSHRSTVYDLPPGRIPLGYCNAINVNLFSSPHLHTLKGDQNNSSSAQLSPGLRRQESRLIPNPISRIGMLGAQARAAELQAAKSAAMRQKAHREAEDLTVPPHSAPVSLTDFARNPLTTKNKGPKAFRPLVDSDLEAMNVQATSRNAVSDSDLSDTTRDGTLKTAPTAPKAMLVRLEQNASKMTPSRAQAPAFTPRSNNPSLMVKDFDTCNGSTFNSPFTNGNVVGYVFGPDDLSPSKQEIKFEEMRQQYNALPTVQVPVHHFPTPFTPDARIFTPQQYQPYQYEQPYQYVDGRPHFPIDANPYNRPQLQHYQSEPAVSTLDYGSNRLYEDRTQSFAEDLIGHHHRLQQQPQTKESPKPSPPIPENDQPYDRTSKMQSFVAAQQAMARKGKTVLHNPTLSKPVEQMAEPISTSQGRKSTPDLPSPTFSSQSRNGLEDVDGVAKARMSRRLEDKEAIVRAMLKRNMHLCLSPGPSIPEEVKDMITGSEQWVEAVSEEWCTLRPITSKERERMRMAMRSLTAKTRSNSNTDIEDTLYVKAKASTDGWDHAETTKTSNRRAAMMKVVDEHEKRVQHSSEFGVIGKPISKEKFSAGSRSTLRAVANVMATLYDSADAYKKDPSTCPYTPVPEYAIDHNDSSSLFDDLSFLTLHERLEDDRE